ncbi:MAG: L-histidine N(alpha)-methyltransferase [Actinobacteria bacterium]|nr:L-histidine N(alpha)-methyltransferase [Actinomycetota bacterium]
MPVIKPAVEVHLTADDLRSALESDVRAALTAEPKDLPPKWFYDDRGSELFDSITRLPEYYLTRAERWILDEYRHVIAPFTGADTIVELGSGTSEKTRLLLDAFCERRLLRRFIPFDVSEATLRAAADSLAEEYPDVEVRAIVGDFDHHLHTLPEGGRRLIAFLGSTIGNFEPKARAEFLAALSAGMDVGDSLLLGTDLVKHPARLVAAYDDPGGVTAEFNRNVLSVVNRELEANFAPHRYTHVARFDEESEWIEMHLRSDVDQRVTVAALDLDVDFVEREAMRTEISAKFRRRQVEDELAAAGLALGRWWMDEEDDFALSLSFKE